MQRLKYGEYQKMTPEQQFQHRKKRRKDWEKRPGNKELVKRLNRKYQKRHWKEVANSYFLRKCKKCGMEVLLRGRCMICDDCKNTISKTQIKKQEIKTRSIQRKERNNRILWLATHTPLTQQEIAEQTNTHQPIVSYILRSNGLRRQPYASRDKK